MKLNYDVEVPKANKRSGYYLELVKEFIESGKPVAEIELEEGRKITVVYNLFYAAMRNRNLPVKLVRKNHKLYLVREEQ